MRLWHSKLIPILDGKRLCDLHMSCCNLRGKGWGKRNAAVGYLYEDPLGEDALAVYHHKVMDEMENRGYRPKECWWDSDYCGAQRPVRKHDPEKYKEAYRRNIPLKGHTLQIFKNDVKALIERGLPIEFSVEEGYDSDCRHYRIYTVRRTDNNTQIKYGVTRSTKDEQE